MDTRTSGSGLGLAGVLTVVFVVLKLVGVITWSWLWVLSPLWISILLGLAFWLIFVVILGAAGAASRRRRR